MPLLPRGPAQVPKTASFGTEIQCGGKQWWDDSSFCVKLQMAEKEGLKGALHISVTEWLGNQDMRRMRLLYCACGGLEGSEQYKILAEIIGDIDFSTKI